MTAPAAIEGRVTVDLFREAGVPPRVAFTMPGDIGALLRGKSPEEALAVVPLVYALCGIAQSHAAVLALEQALGIVVSPRTLAAREALTAMETLREHSLRITLDWSAFLGLSPSPERLRPLMTFVPSLAAALFDGRLAFALGREAAPDAVAAAGLIDSAESLLIEEVFGEPLERWLARRGMDDLLGWARAADTVAAGLLAEVAARGWQGAGASPARPAAVPSAARLRRWLRGDDVLALPAEEAEVPETTQFSRRAGDPLLASLAGSGLAARLTARLVELAQLPGSLRRLVAGTPAAQPLAPAGGGFGCAAVEAARGLLIHVVELQGRSVARYRILPPTRWNFDGQGVAQRCLSRLCEAEDAARLRQAEMLVNAIDPCVGHDVRLH